MVVVERQSQGLRVYQWQYTRFDESEMKALKNLPQKLAVKILGSLYVCPHIC